MATIVEIVDHNRAIIDGPTSGVTRRVIHFNCLNLTDLVVENLPRAAHTKTVRKILTEQKTAEQWAATPTAKKLAAKKRRSELNDFQRFKVKLLKQKRNRILQSC